MGLSRHRPHPPDCGDYPRAEILPAHGAVPVGVQDQSLNVTHRCVTMMCHNQNMKKASIRDLHMRTGALVQEAADGEVIIIEKRGVPVAELRRIRKGKVGEAFRELERSGYFARMGKTDSNIDRLISEDRDR